MNDTLWLIVDVGTSGAKAALMMASGELVQTATQPYDTFSAEGGMNEQNAADWWDAVIAACQSFGVEVQRVSAVAVTGQMQDAILIDSAGTPTHPVILYNDMRAHAEAETITARVGADRLMMLTGNEQGADSLWAKLLWLTLHRADAVERAQHILFGAADAIIFHLTGKASTDTTTAATTGLMNLRERGWLDANVLAMMGIGACVGKLPPLVAGGSRVGTVTEPAAAALGIPVGIPVYHAPGDAGAATIGAGSGDMGRAYGYLGTSGWIAFTADAPGAPQNGVFTLAHPQPDRFIQIAPLLTAAGNLEWVHTLFPAESVQGLIDEACARPSSNVIYLPYLNGERTPFRDPLARAAFIGMGGATERADLVRAVLEGVAFGYRHALDALMPQPPDRLILTGGGTRSRAWCQVFADVLGIELLIGSGAEHVGVRGALLAAQVAQGELTGYTPSGFPPIDATLTPNAAQQALYQAKYATYRAAYPALKDLFAQLQR
ncbi:MAG: FGGY family carbohydrate kinase [Chloroflexota bacterium]|nr:FGGY family carbohydrate kinase [Chloroflexota bacterium]